MKEWVRFSRSSGEYSKQAHTKIPRGVFEREVGREGFYGPVSHLYHQHAPTSWSNIDGPLRPHAFDTQKIPASSVSPIDAAVLANNSSCRISYWACSQTMDHLFRNADGDLLLFTHGGAGSLFCDFGHLDFSEGDYLLIPRGVMWRIEIQTPCKFLMIEASRDGFQLPQKSILGEHAIFDSEVLESPSIDEAFKSQWSEEPWQVYIQCRQKRSVMTYPFNPLDTKGWKGTLSVLKINWRDLCPLVCHRVHLPPSAHTTFLSSQFVVCTFVPRPIESSPEALKVPFYHSNADYDEFIFYHQGDFFSRDDIGPGMCTLHPAGFPHGPHPKAYQASYESPKKETDEVAVMIDTRDALDLSPKVLELESADYWKSWQEKS